MKKFTKTTLAIAATLMVFQHAHADYNIADVANVNITGNTDNSVGTEGVFIRSNGNAAAHLYLGTDSVATLGAQNVSINAFTATINSTVANIGRSGNAVVNIGNASSVNTIAGSTNATGALTQTGTTNINTSGTEATSIGTAGGNINLGGVSSTNTILGTTSINASGNANTIIGNAANTTTIQSGVNTITGGANSILSTGANTITAATGNAISTAAGNNSITATAGANSISAGTSNTINAGTSNTMNAGVANNIQGPQNNIGTSSASANTIGNALAATTVTSVAGNASQALANGTARTLVSNGVSDLIAGQTTNAEMLLRNAAGTTVDANGKILQSGATGYVAPTGATAALTLTNGYGNTHGLVVTESQTTLSGGTQSSSMSLTDRAATFSNAQTGAPITVTGVANGRADFDAVNVRQFAGAIAAVSAQANIPALAEGQDRSVGVGVANFMGKSALAVGLTVRGNSNAMFKASLSSGLNQGSGQAVLGVGASWGF